MTIKQYVSSLPYFLLTTFLLLGCSTSPTGRSQLIMVSNSEMNSMGTQSFEDLKKKTPIEYDGRTNNYVKCIALAVANEARDRTGVRSWEVVVFKDATANAFALPGGKIGVHTGILQVARTADQLAAVLGHEVGHVIARHGAERVSQAIAAQGGLVLTDIFIGNKTSDENRAYIMAALGIGGQGFLLKFSRDHELEGDLIGLDLMSRAGFNPRESIELWKNMSKATGGKQTPEWLSTHPSHSTRIHDLESNMPKALRSYEAAMGNGKNPNCGSL